MKYKKIIVSVILTLFVAGTFLYTFAATPPTVTTHSLEIDIDVNDFTEKSPEIKQENELKDDAEVRLFGQRDNASIIPVSPDNYYGRQALTQTERGTIRTAIYDSIVYAVEHEMGKAEFRNIEAQVSKEDCDVAWDAVRYDYPQLFYYNTYQFSYRYTSYSGRYDSGIPEEDIDCVALGIIYHQFSDLEREKVEFEETSDYLIASAGITPGDSDYEKAKKLHNTLIGWVEYDRKAAEENSANSLSHTAYNAIVNHSAVCDGYARAYQYLLYKVGILSHIITGYGQSGTSPENHAWNMVWLDEKPYYTDVTWDDMRMKNGVNAGISYRYFNINDDILKKDHCINKKIDHNNGNAIVAESLGYELPVCTATDKWYYNNDGVRLTTENQNDEETINKVATLLAYDVKARIFVDGISFDEWWNNNNYKIFLAYRDITSCRDIPQVGYTLSDNEYSLFFVESGTIKVNDDYEIFIYHNKDHSGKLCQMIYDENGVGAYYNMSDIGVSEKDEIISIMMYPWKKNLKYTKARYMFLDFDNNFSPLTKKYDIEI